MSRLLFATLLLVACAPTDEDESYAAATRLMDHFHIDRWPDYTTAAILTFECNHAARRKAASRSAEDYSMLCEPSPETYYYKYWEQRVPRTRVDPSSVDEDLLLACFNTNQRSFDSPWHDYERLPEALTMHRACTRAGLGPPDDN